MKITYELELKPFSVPNFVIPVTPVRPRQDGFKPVEGIALKELSFATLEKLCEEFTETVMMKAGYPSIGPKDVKKA